MIGDQFLNHACQRSGSRLRNRAGVAVNQDAGQVVGTRGHHAFRHCHCSQDGRNPSRLGGVVQRSDDKQGIAVQIAQLVIRESFRSQGYVGR